MDVVDSRRQGTFTGIAARSISACRLICRVGHLLSLIVAVMAALVLVGLLGTQALAHDGHDALTGAAPPGVGGDASADEVAPPGDIATVTSSPILCDGHCCVGGVCCPAVAVALDASPTRPRPVAPAAAPAVDLIAAGPPDGPRRPPKTRV